MIIEVINGLLDYSIEPLSQDLLLELPKMKRGQRIVAIRKARGMNQQIELRKKAQLGSATCSTIETRDHIPLPRHLYNISRVLRVDPLLIVFGQSWEEVSPRLTDGEKMYFLRLRRGWVQEALAIELEKNGLIFNTDHLDSKRTAIAQWERGAATPTPEKRTIIRKVLGDETLFQKTAVFVQKTVTQRAAPVAPDKPKSEPVPESVAKPESTRQEQIDAKTYEALVILESLKTIQIDKNTNLNSYPSVLEIRALIRELRQMEAEEEARVIEIDLEKELTALRQKIVIDRKPMPQIEPRPKISAVDRKKANQTISNWLQRFQEWSILQILPFLVRSKDWIAVLVAVERIEEHQAKKLRPEDWIYLQELKSRIPIQK